MINFSAGAIDLNFLDQKTFLNQTKCPNTLKCHLGDLKISIFHRFYKGFATLRSFLDSVLDQNTKFSSVFSRFCEKWNFLHFPKSLFYQWFSIVFSDFWLQMDPPFCSNPLFCKGFHAFPGLQWPISGPLEPKKRFFAKKSFFNQWSGCRPEPQIWTFWIKNILNQKPF